VFADRSSLFASSVRNEHVASNSVESTRDLELDRALAEDHPTS